MSDNQPSKIISQSAMVRILFEIQSYPKKELFASKPKVVVKKVDIFPLAFIFSEDCLQDQYSLISQAIHEEPRKILDNIPTTDPGVYEMVGEFFGKFTINDHTATNRLWELQEIKAYQLTDEEISQLPSTLKPDGINSKV